MEGMRTKAFTLIELLVAVSLLTIIIVVIGAVFRTTGRAIRASNATIETDAAVRAVMRQIANDVSRIDREGFLVIRANGGWNPNRYQLTLLAHGGFQSRGGPVDAHSVGVMPDLQSHSALVWYGFALPPEDTGPSSQNISTSIAQNTGVSMTDRGTDTQNGVLGRHAFLLLPANSTAAVSPVNGLGGQPVPAHRDISRTAAPIAVSTGASPIELPAHPASGRTDVAALTPSQIMARIRVEKYRRIATPGFMAFGTNPLYSGISPGLVVPGPNKTNALGGVSNSNSREGGFAPPLADSPYQGASFSPPYDGPDYWYEARYYCYPRKLLRTPVDGTNSNGNLDVINGTYRMMPTLLKSAETFVVEWTDGSTDATGNIRWFGRANSDGVDTLDNLNDAASPARPIIWPPVEFFTKSLYTGSADRLFSNSPLPALTDKSGELLPWQTLNSPTNYYHGRSTMVTRDVYTAVFGSHCPVPWPKALRVSIRFEMRQTEVTNRGPNPNRPRRTYTQVIWLP